MGKVLPFLGGCIVSGVMILKHTYENESIKQTVEQEISKLHRMKNSELDQVAKIRRPDHELRR